MVRLRPVGAAIAVALATTVHAQAGSWLRNQVNTTICAWDRFSAAVLKDTLYLDGGDIYWLPGMADGNYGTAFTDYNPQSLVYALNFSQSFNLTDNTTALFTTFSKAGSAKLPNIYEGSMMGNDDEWWLYGGTIVGTTEYTLPAGDAITEYAKYQYGTAKPFTAGSSPQELQGVTRYIAFGGYANVPSENKAFFFGGQVSPSNGPIYDSEDVAAFAPTNASNTLITLDMSTQGGETWSNVTLPSNIRGRANPELVWVPVGAQGILVALGGVLYPEYVNPSRKSANESGSEAVSPTFMTTIDIYDIASGKWYQQPTMDGPGILVKGCAVMSPSQDYSSFNIYYYGGYDGLHQTQPNVYSDDVWVLSIPSFMWMKIAPSRSGKARAGHKCVKPYANQMMVVGGLPAGGTPTPLNGGLIELFNMSSGKWLDHFDSTLNEEYTVPEMIYLMIGGSPTGGATALAPEPTGWATPALGQVFATSYPTNKLTTYYPYATAAPSGSNGSSNGGGSTSVVPIVIGVILGLVVIIVLLVVWYVIRRRKLLKRDAAASNAPTDPNDHRIMSWMRGQQSDVKAPTVTATEERPRSPETEAAPYNHTDSNHFVAHEMDNTYVAELMDTSHPVEMADTGLTPVDVINKHTHFGNGTALGDPSFYSSNPATDHASMVSDGSGPLHTGRPLQPASSPHPSQFARADSPPLPPLLVDPVAQEHQHQGQVPVAPLTSGPIEAAPTSSSPPPRMERINSGVSETSEHEKGHLRSLSDPESISTMGVATSASDGNTYQAYHPSHADVISPPVIDEEDETGHGGVLPVNPLRSNPSNPSLAGSPRKGRSENVPAVPGARTPSAAGKNRQSVFFEDRDGMEG